MVVCLTTSSVVQNYTDSNDIKKKKKKKMVMMVMMMTMVCVRLRY